MTCRVSLTNRHKKEFTDTGFTVLERILEPGFVARLREMVMSLAQWEEDCKAANFYDSAGKMQRVWNLLNKGPVWGELIQMPVVLECMDWIFDRPTVHQKYFLSSFQANIISPGAEALKLHIDTPVPEPLPPWIIKANTIWLLDTFTAMNGATEVLPGSHKYSYKPGADDQHRTDLQTIVAPAGSIVLTHGALWHRSGPNRSDSDRIALLGSFAASYAREIANEEDYAKVLDRNVLDQASEKLREILGVNQGVKQGARTPSRR